MWPAASKFGSEHTKRTAIGFILTGLVLLLMTRQGALPMSWIATALSSDGNLTATFICLIERSQLTLSIILLTLGALAPIIAHPLLQLARWFSSRSPWSVSITCGLVACVGSAAINYFWYDGIPHVTDEISHLFQAKILEVGRWAAPAPPCPMNFHQPHIIISANGLWHTIYPPGHPVLLTLFGWAGLLAFAGPICHAVAVVAAHRLALRFWDKSIAHASAAMLSLSPQWLLLGASWMSHMSFSALNLSGWALWLAAHDGKVNSPRRLGIAAAGLMLAWSAIIRPQDFILTSAIAVFALLLHPHLIAPLLRQTPALFAGAIPVILFTGAWNMALYGAPWAMGYGHSSSLTPQTQPIYGFTDTFGWKEAAAITTWSLLRLNKSLLGWPSSLIFIPFLLILRPYAQRRDIVCLVGAALIVFFFFFYFYYGTEYEARFYCSAVPLLIIATSRSIKCIADWWEARTNKPPIALGLAIAACALHSLFFYIPSYLAPRYGHGYEQASMVIETTTRSAGLTNAIVLVPSGKDERFRYSGAFPLNDPMLSRPVLYVRDLADSMACLRDAFPERSFYRFVPENDWRGGRLVQVWSASNHQASASP